jgi:hypothetical protein
VGVKPIPGMKVIYVGEFVDGQSFYLNPGELALLINTETLRRYWWFRCHCGSGGVLNGHEVSSTDPVNISPSIMCPSGCHYYIKNGMIV